MGCTNATHLQIARASKLKKAVGALSQLLLVKFTMLGTIFGTAAAVVSANVHCTIAINFPMIKAHFPPAYI
jgi:hypothetical protein